VTCRPTTSARASIIAAFEPWGLLDCKVLTGLLRMRTPSWFSRIVAEASALGCHSHLNLDENTIDMHVDCTVAAEAATINALATSSVVWIKFQVMNLRPSEPSLLSTGHKCLLNMQARALQFQWCYQTFRLVTTLVFIVTITRNPLITQQPIWTIMKQFQADVHNPVAPMLSPIFNWTNPLSSKNNKILAAIW